VRRARAAAALLLAVALAACQPPPEHPALAELCAGSERGSVVRAAPFDALFVQSPYLPFSYPDEYDPQLGHQTCFSCVELLLERGLASVEFPIGDAGGFALPDPDTVGRTFLAPAGDARCAWLTRFERKLPMLMGRGRFRRTVARIPAGRCAALEAARRSAPFALMHESEPAAGPGAYVYRETFRLTDLRSKETLATATTFAQSGGDFADRLCEGHTRDAWRRLALDRIFQARRIP
jgi:hypothetical protein